MIATISLNKKRIHRFNIMGKLKAFIFAVIATLISSCSCECQDSANWPRESFVREKWLSGERHRYVFDLVMSEKLIGKSVAEIIEILGPPNRHENLSSRLVYDILYRGLTNRSYYLYIKYDAVTKIYLGWAISHELHDN